MPQSGLVKAGGFGSLSRSAANTGSWASDRRAEKYKAGGELSVGLAGFARFNVALTLVWLWTAFPLGREHRLVGF
ncbi:MAG: hypothetical protein ACKV2U_14325 [Bryobacteraceae bacterium]